MKKYLLALLLITNTSIAQDLSCGQTKTTSSVFEHTAVEVFTKMPESLKGGKIILVKADGSQEILKTEEYMLVKRKHTRPFIIEKVATSTLMCKDNKVNNILSLKAVNSYGDPDKNISGSKGKISTSRETTLGAQYQRNLGKNIFLGVEGDLNQGAGVLLGIGF